MRLRQSISHPVKTMSLLTKITLGIGAVILVIGSTRVTIAALFPPKEYKGDGEATELWLHFQKVVNWIETLFPNYRREMKGLEWGRLYCEFSSKSYNPKELERRVVELMTDKEVQHKKGNWVAD